MEDWQFELEFLTHEEYENAVSKANGLERRTEEFEMDETTFKTDLESLMNNTSPDEWEVIK